MLTGDSTTAGVDLNFLSNGILGNVQATGTAPETTNTAGSTYAPDTELPAGMPCSGMLKAAAVAAGYTGTIDDGCGGTYVVP